MKIKTAELTGHALDWALAVVLELGPCVMNGRVLTAKAPFGWPIDGVRVFGHAYPATFVGLIKEHCVQLYPFCRDGKAVHWDADIRPYIRVAGCDTPEQAVARCVVAMRLGDEVDVPDELCGVQSCK